MRLTLALALLLAVPGPAQEARITTVRAPEGMTFQQVLTGDVDGDGLEDLLVAAALEGERYARRILVYLRRPGAVPFEATPSRELALPPDATAFALGDVHADPGAEVLLFSARGAYAWRTAREGAGRVVALASAEFLWQLPHRSQTLPWQAGVRDIDGDGLVDLFLPGPDGYTLFFQKRDAEGNASFERSHRLVLPPSVEAETFEIFLPGRATGRRALRARMAPLLFEAGMVREPLLVVEESLPSPRFVDWDGNGRLDLVGRSVERLHVWLQGPDGFEPLPGIDLEAPVVADRSRRLDLSYSAHVADLSGNGKADCVLVAGDQRGRRVATQVLVFLQAEGQSLFGEAGRPDQLLVLSGFARFPELIDVFGAGRPDLVVATFRPDTIDLIRSARTEEVDLELLVYRNQGGRFSRRPDLTFPLRIQARNLGDPGQEPALAFIGDIHGNGLSELLVRDRPDRIRLFAPTVRRGAVAIPERPFWEMALDRNATVQPRPGQRPELLVVERGQVVHVRFE